MLGNLIFSYTHTQAGNVHSYGQVGQRVAGSRGVVLQGSSGQSLLLGGRYPAITS